MSGTSEVPRGAGAVPSPDQILSMEPAEADELLDKLESAVPVSPGWVDIDAAGASEAIVFGDSHGDWRSTLAVARRFLDDPISRMLIGLGDYVDRPPEDCGEGSVANALYLLALQSQHPGRVHLFQGNHETVRKIPVFPEHLSEEVDLLWGPDATRYARLLGLLERGPIAGRVSSGVYLAHAGFPQQARGEEARRAMAEPSEDTLLDVTWRECGASRIRRGVSNPFTAAELAEFLASIDATAMLRGHDPDLTGRIVFQERCLTLHTSRGFERFGGVVIGHLPLAAPVESARSVRVEHLETEGQTYASAV